MRRLSLFERDIDPARIGVGWLPAWASAALGQRRRRLGLYDAATLNLLRRAWERRPTPGHLLGYARFRRDLGQLLSRDEAGKLLAAIGQFSATEVRQTLHLALESGLIEAAVAAWPRAELVRWAATSPPIAGALYPESDRAPGAASRLARLHRGQDELRQELGAYLGGHAGSICIVGNAGALVGGEMGERIDRHQVVVRFNRYRSVTSRDQDIGRGLNVWVRAPDLGGFALPSPDPWVVLSGPDVRYHLRDWSAVAPHLAAGARVVTVPLGVWARLVDELRAPPSAGVLFLAWAMEMVGAAEKLTAVGFQTDQPPAGARYHQALPRHRPSGRHHWAGERALLRRWRDQGLVFLA